MKLSALIAVLLLTGCATSVPVRQTWPVAPQQLMEPCPPLKTMEGERTSLRDLLLTVIDNYAVYYQCSNRTQAWADWYNQQRRVFEETNR